MKNEIKITFVKSPEEGEICAVFVNEFWDRSKTKLTSYMHIGQHAGCSPDILKNWPLATEQEYRSLLEELNTIGYDWTQICFSMQNAVQAAANIWGISSDEQINKMRAFITEMVLIELSNLKQFDIVFKKKGIRSLDTLYCPKCGSNNVEERAWVNPNTDEISYNDSVEEEDCWCGICEEHVELCTLSELWEMFGDIPVNNDDEIEEDFLNFPVGTSKIDVWHWFDERCPNNLHDDLMYPKNDAV